MAKKFESPSKPARPFSVAEAKFGELLKAHRGRKSRQSWLELTAMKIRRIALAQRRESAVTH